MRVILLFLAFLFVTDSVGQNLVPNASFEDTISCPFGNFEIDKAVSWHSAGGSPDYYHSCAMSGGASVPSNFYGYQNAASGNAYIGLFTYNRDVSYPGNREHVQAELVTPLMTGTKYYVSFDISFTLDTNEIGFASNKLGVLFTNTTNYNSGNPPILSNNSQIYIDTIIYDTTNWYHFQSSFIADSAYQKILFGNFFDDVNTDILGIDTSLYTAAYYIDNVCVSLDSSDCFMPTGLNIQNSTTKTVKIYPNPSNGSEIWLNLSNWFHHKELTYSIFNSVGQEIMEDSFFSDSLDKSFNISNFPTGVYYLRISTGLEFITKTFIIN